MSLRILSAAAQRVASKPKLALEPLPFNLADFFFAIVARFSCGCAVQHCAVRCKEWQLLRGTPAIALLGCGNVLPWALTCRFGASIARTKRGILQSATQRAWKTVTWETRKRGGRYYTRSRRVGGKVFREYIGGGRVAEIVSRMDQQKRHERVIHAAAVAKQRAEEAEIDTLVDQLGRIADLAGRAALLAAGFHQHHGQWRKRRGKSKEAESS